MSHRDVFTGVRHGLYVNGVKIEEVDGYYYDNKNVGIPDGCYNDGEVLSQFGSTLFVPGIEFTAYGIVSSGVWKGYSTMWLGTSFSAYGETAEVPTGERPRVISAPLRIFVEIDKTRDDGQGGESTWGMDGNVDIKMEGV